MEMVVIAGGPAQEAAVAGLRAGFPKKDAYDVSYESVGPQLAFNGFLAKKYDVAMIGHPLSATEWQLAQQTCAGRALTAPILPSPLALTYNLEGAEGLRLTAASVDALLSGRITAWNDPALQADNPDVALPDKEVTVVRSKVGGDVQSALAGYLGRGGITTDVDQAGPVSVELTDDAVAMADTVRKTAGAVAVMELRHAGGLQQAQLATETSFVSPNEDDKDGALSTATTQEVAPGRWELLMPDGYPLVLVSYAVTCLPVEGDGGSSFVSFAVTEEGQLAAASAAGSPPLPFPALARVKSG